MSEAFTTVRTAGSLLPPDLLARVLAGDRSLPGMTSADYHLGGSESARDAANRHWGHLRATWAAFRAALAHLPEGDPAIGLTREKWLTVLFDALGYGRLASTPAGGLVVAGQAYPVSHAWGATPIHLLGWGVDLDRRSTGVAGAARRPHSMVQELLNRSGEHLWALLSNGRLLRVLRDSASLSGQAYVEFDLQAIFDGEVFADFVLLFLTAHQSRVEPRADKGSESTAESTAECWLEVWRTTAAESGTRALGLLRDGVQAAITTLGTGFLHHPDNADLSRSLADGSLRLHDYHTEVLHLVYRLLFLFVAEDRDLLLRPDADPLARQRYAGYFSTARLRRLATTRRGDRHGDLWQALTLVLDALGDADGQPELGLAGLGGLFYRYDEDLADPAEGPGDADPEGPPDDRLLELLRGRSLANTDLLTAVRHLAVVQPKGQPKRLVDYRNLGAEELGGIYESLLELVPRHRADTREFTLESLPGNDRKTSGSYYTPTSLIDLVLDEALDPLLDDAQRSADPEAALLAMTVCDPACGSAHFLVAAARRMAHRLAAVRTGDPDPAPVDVRAATYDVIGRCVYGVDLNPMAAELAKVSLWLESVQPGRPLAFLDHHVKVGNGLLGATPALIEGGIPDAAFAPIEGDDKKYAAHLRKGSRAEHDRVLAAQDDLFATTGVEVSNRSLRAQVVAADRAQVLSLNDLKLARRRYREIERSPAGRRLRLVADAWCAAFVQLKTKDGPRITYDTLAAATSGALDPAVAREVGRLSTQYRFFHWHLEFPEIFDVPDGGAAETATGWRGGFTAMLGNPPWERVKLQEQEFFATRDFKVAGAGTAAKRKEAIKALAGTDPALFAEFTAARRRSEGESHLLRSSGRYPLCGAGDVNTYSVFAEHLRTVIAPAGRMGVITPTGLATDNTTAPFFADTLRAARLAAFYDFENEAKIFAGVHNQFRFAITVMSGGERIDEVRMAFYTRHVEDVEARRFELAADEVPLLNPNTGTLPVFRSRIDAEITLGIYRRHPVLIRDGDPDGNPWGLRFARLFDMANDSGLFHTERDLRELGAAFDGWAWADGATRWLPLYEAKMLSHYDHRFSTYADATQAQLNKGTLPRPTAEQHDDPAAEPLARYWIAEPEVAKALAGRWDRDWLLGWRDIARASDSRTMTPSVLPRSGIGHKFPVAMPMPAKYAALLHAVWSSFAFDYVARQKLSGTGMTYFILKQIACPGPAVFEQTPTWAGERLGGWIVPRVLELSYTSYRIAGYARDHGDDGPPFRWDVGRREAIRAELDAAMFHVYGLERPEVEHVLDSFFVVRKYEERDHGEFRTRRLVLDRYDAMQRAAETGAAYRTPIDPPPGHGPRHPTASNAAASHPAGEPG